MGKKNASIQNDGDHPLMDIEKNAQNEETAVADESQEDTADSDKDQNLDNGEKNQENGSDADNSEVSEAELPKILTAIYPILYLSHQYKVGEELPANDPGMVEAWITAGTAAWLPVREPAVKAKPQTAEPGLPGQAAASESEDGDNLAGKVPKTNKRGKL